MKKLKQICIVALFLCLSFLVTGCVTTPSGQRVIDPDKVSKLAPALQASTAGAVIYAYSKDTNVVTYVSFVKTAVQEFALSNDLNAATLRAKLDNLPIKQLHTAEAQLIITPVISAYKAYGEQYVRAGLDPNEGLRLLLKAITDGISDGEEGIKAIQTQ